MNPRVVERAKLAGAMRPDLVVGDLGLIFEQLAAIRHPSDQRTAELRHRYLELHLDGIRTHGAPLPGPPPDQTELAARWDRSTGSA